MTVADGLMARLARWPGLAGGRQAEAEAKATISDSTFSGNGTGQRDTRIRTAPRPRKPAASPRRKRMMPWTAAPSGQSQQRQRGDLDEEQRREEQDPVQGRIGRNRGIGPGHDDEVKRKLKDHRRGHSTDSGARQRGAPATRTADNKDNDEDHSYADGGNGRNGIRRGGVKQVLPARLVNVDRQANQKRRNRKPPGHEHKGPGALAGPCWPDGQRQPGFRIRHAARGGHQDTGEHDPGGAAIAEGPGCRLAHTAGGDRPQRRRGGEAVPRPRPRGAPGKPGPQAGRAPSRSAHFARRRLNGLGNRWPHTTDQEPRCAKAGESSPARCRRASSAATATGISVTPTPYATRSYATHADAPSGSRATHGGHVQRPRSRHQGAENRSTLHQYCTDSGQRPIFYPDFYPNGHRSGSGGAVSPGHGRKLYWPTRSRVTSSSKLVMRVRFPPPALPGQ